MKIKVTTCIQFVVSYWEETICVILDYSDRLIKHFGNCLETFEIPISVPEYGQIFS